MTKRDSHKDNIILFPGLDRRLMEKGLEHLQQKKYRDATHFFEQALKLDPVNGDIYIGLVLANFESGHLKEAKELAAEMLRKGIGDYIEIIDLYIMILVQLNEYDEIVSTIEALLEEREIPKEKLEHFSRMLHFSRRMAQGKGNEATQESLESEYEDERLSLFTYQDPKDQVLLAARLSKENIRPYLEEIKSYLASDEGHPFQKTMLLNILREQEYDREIDITKFARRKTVIPSNLPELQDMEGMQPTVAILRDELENRDPVLFENIKSLIERHNFLLYPFEPEPLGPAVWAAAYYHTAREYYGSEESVEEAAGIYGVSASDAEQAVLFIKSIEEISYPGI
ncbi:tetratricopeptide repeat protein [Bacillus sp. T33-2]|uniref:tetratricopeptide repeat protein n=1 Tax=Bacillus sp. T33-2 TaxID=2054168 RepID=UPI000C75F066|nr:tetratricopeptide repeat protein [Bacillus sp. T33-2]PLR93686.1 hypothetical protein CVD19_18305 [Bacillus sp. T33-2]